MCIWHQAEREGSGGDARSHLRKGSSEEGCVSGVILSSDSPFARSRPRVNPNPNPALN